MAKSTHNGMCETWKDYSPLMKEAHLGNIDEVRRAHEESGNNGVNDVGGWNGTTALMLAARAGRVEVAEYLLSAGADVNIQNNLGNTALLLSAEAGHIGVVEALLSHHADVNIQNSYGQTALMLATENGHLSVVQLLVGNDDISAQLSIRNKYDKTALLIACQLGKYDIVEWILNNSACDVNIRTTHRGMTGLMYASSYHSASHEQIVDLLLAHGADVNICSLENDTALLWATIGGRTTVVQKLIKAGANVNQVNNRGFTALMNASERGNEPVVRCLIANGADKWTVNRADKDAMKLAWLRGHIDMATNVFMFDDEFGMMTTPVTTIFTDEELDELGLIYSNPTQFLILKSLVSAAAKYDFHFDLFIRLLPRLQTPNSILNKQLPIFYRCFFERSKTLDVDLVFKLVQLAAALQQVELKHPLEKIDFKERNNVIMEMLVECVSSDCMDEEKNLRDILCFAIKWEQKHYRDELVEKAQTFRCGLLEVCIRNRIKAIFSSGHISAYVATLFWGFLRKGDSLSYKHSFSGPYRLASRLGHFRYSPESENIRHLKSHFIHCRYCPAIMFIGEGISKCFTLFLLTHLSVSYYFDKTSIPGLNWEEKTLAVIIVGMCFYEWGELCENDITVMPSWRSICNHLLDVFKWFDIGSVGLLVTWLVFKFDCEFGTSLTDTERVQFTRNYKASLATSAILLSLGTLRYFSVWEPLGKLTIMVFAMMKDLASFAIFFLICIFGFCVAFFSLFRDDYPFATSGQTSLTLFSATLNNYDATFEAFQRKDGMFSLGIVLEVIYIILSSVVLMNLVVAKMAATHHDIDQRSFQEWQFATARTVKQFLLFEEKNPLCMLPAPLNLVPAIVFPIHWVYLNRMSKLKLHEIESSKTRFAPNATLVSFAGSASDVLVGIVFSFIAPFIEMVSYFVRMFHYKKRHRHSDLRKGKTAPLLRLEPLLFFVLFPFIYPFFVIKLLIESCSLLTKLTLEHTDQGIRRIVDFAHRSVYRKPVLNHSNSGGTDSTADMMIINILRGEKLRRCYDNSNVAVKVRLGDMEQCTNLSLYRGCDPVFTNEILHFPLAGLDFEHHSFSLVFEVVDRDIFSGFESVVGTTRMSPEATKAFVANGRLEERIALDDGDGYIVCVGKVDFPTFLTDRIPAVAVEPHTTPAEKIKIRKVSYKESYASFRRRHSKISPEDDSSSPESMQTQTTPAVLEECKSENRLTVVSSSDATETTTHSRQRMDVTPNGGRDEVVVMRTSSSSSTANASFFVDNSSTAPAGNKSEHALGISVTPHAAEPQSDVMLYSTETPSTANGIAAASPMKSVVNGSPLPIMHFRNLAAARGASTHGRPNTPALQTVQEDEPLAAHNQKASSRSDVPHPPTSAVEYHKAVKVPPIFTLADKERIFFHALRPRGLSTSSMEAFHMGSSAVPSPNRSQMLQPALNAYNFPQGPGRDSKVYNYLFSSSVDPHDNFKSLSDASTPVYNTTHGTLHNSVDNMANSINFHLGTNLNSFIVPGSKSFYPVNDIYSNTTAHHQLLRRNTNEEDYDAFALSNPNDIAL